MLAILTASVQPGSPVCEKPGMLNCAIPDVFGMPARLPLGIPSALFSLIPNEFAWSDVKYRLNPSRNELIELPEKMWSQETTALWLSEVDSGPPIMKTVPGEGAVN